MLKYNQMRFYLIRLNVNFIDVNFLTFNYIYLHIIRIKTEQLMWIKGSTKCIPNGVPQQLGIPTTIECFTPHPCECSVGSCDHVDNIISHE